MMKRSRWFITLTAMLAVFALMGCTKKDESADVAPGTTPPGPNGAAAGPPPEVRSQIEAAQRSDAAGRAAVAPKTP